MWLDVKVINLSSSLSVDAWTKKINKNIKKKAAANNQRCDVEKSYFKILHVIAASLSWHLVLTFTITKWFFNSPLKHKKSSSTLASMVTWSLVLNLFLWGKKLEANLIKKNMYNWAETVVMYINLYMVLTNLKALIQTQAVAWPLIHFNAVHSTNNNKLWRSINTLSWAI